MHGRVRSLPTLPLPILALVLLAAGVAHAESKPRLPLLANDAAWQRLPGAPKDAQPLAAWARALTGLYPVSTARLLELDAMHRTGDRLDARLRGLVRFAAADANRSPYGKAMAAADFRRAGGTDAQLKAPDKLSAIDRAAVAFSRKMMTEAHAVTDAEFRHLLDLVGEERMMALVALLAHASFQDRLFLAINIDETTEKPLPPLAVTFARPKPKGGGPPVIDKGLLGDPRRPADQGWLGLQEELDRQRNRAGRIRVPTHAETLARMGEKHPGAWQADILWSRVAYGYQPELTDAWFTAVGAFRQETEWDPVFSQSIFWIVTRSLKCFY